MLICGEMSCLMLRLGKCFTCSCLLILFRGMERTILMLNVSGMFFIASRVS